MKRIDTQIATLLPMSACATRAPCTPNISSAVTQTSFGEDTLVDGDDPNSNATAEKTAPAATQPKTP